METFRYDFQEDRANDIKRHDNKHHLSDRKNKLRLLAAQEEFTEGVRGKSGLHLTAKPVRGVRFPSTSTKKAAIFQTAL